MVLICDTSAIRRKSYFFLGARFPVVLNLMGSTVFQNGEQLVYFGN